MGETPVNLLNPNRAYQETLNILRNGEYIWNAKQCIYIDAMMSTYNTDAFYSVFPI